MHAIDDFRETHKLCDVLVRDGILAVRFSDGSDLELSGCWPVDSSIYRDTGRWSCTVEQYLGADEQKKSLFRPDSSVDIHEQDIILVTDRSTGDVLYRKT